MVDACLSYLPDHERIFPFGSIGSISWCLYSRACSTASSSDLSLLFVPIFCIFLSWSEVALLHDSHSDSILFPYTTLLVVNEWWILLLQIESSVNWECFLERDVWNLKKMHSPSPLSRSCRIDWVVHNGWYMRSWYFDITLATLQSVPRGRWRVTHSVV